MIAGINWAVANRDLYGIEAINLSLGTERLSTTATAPRPTPWPPRTPPGSWSWPRPATRARTSARSARPAPRRTRSRSARWPTSRHAAASTPAEFSSRGPTADGRIKPDVMGPGVGIASAVAGTSSGYGSWNGTSMSAPFVTGVALLMRDANPALTPDQVKDGDEVHRHRLRASRAPDADCGRRPARRLRGARGGGSRARLRSRRCPPHAHVDGTLGTIGSAKEYEIQVDDPSLPLTVTVIRRASTLVRHETTLISPSGRGAGLSLDPRPPGRRRRRSGRRRAPTSCGSGRSSAPAASTRTSPAASPARPRTSRRTRAARAPRARRRRRR